MGATAGGETITVTSSSGAHQADLSRLDLGRSFGFFGLIAFVLRAFSCTYSHRHRSLRRRRPIGVFPLNESQHSNSFNIHCVLVNIISIQPIVDAAGLEKKDDDEL